MNRIETKSFSVILTCPSISAFMDDYDGVGFEELMILGCNSVADSDDIEVIACDGGEGYTILDWVETMETQDGSEEYDQYQKGPRYFIQHTDDRSSVDYKDSEISACIHRNDGDTLKCLGKGTFKKNKIGDWIEKIVNKDISEWYSRFISDLEITHDFKIGENITSFFIGEANKLFVKGEIIGLCGPSVLIIKDRENKVNYVPSTTSYRDISSSKNNMFSPNDSVGVMTISADGENFFDENIVFGDIEEIREDGSLLVKLEYGDSLEIPQELLVLADPYLDDVGTYFNLVRETC